MLGVGLTMPLTCALAALQTMNAGRIAANQRDSRAQPPFARHSSGALVIGHGRASVVRREKISSGRCSNHYRAFCPTSSALHRTSRDFFAQLDSPQNAD